MQITSRAWQALRSRIDFMSLPVTAKTGELCCYSHHGIDWWAKLSWQVTSGTSLQKAKVRLPLPQGHLWLYRTFDRIWLGLNNRWSAYWPIDGIWSDWHSNPTVEPAQKEFFAPNSLFALRYIQLCMEVPFRILMSGKQEEPAGPNRFKRAQEVSCSDVLRALARLTENIFIIPLCS